ncbi:SIS domain-containing protein [Candidatus Pacearchaeota archaeon]|nr:SIS domain-containing protein [Candidatus Pacearchaeota archaeon]
MSDRETENLIDLYVKEKRELLKNFPTKDIAEIAEVVWTAYQAGGTIYACGNGGNAAYVANMLTDFSMHPFVSDDKSSPLPDDIPRLKVYNMTSEGTTLTALLNDIGPHAIFSQQLINNGAGPNDVLFGFSGSGNSENILEAFSVAKKYNTKTIAITRGDGGKSKDAADYCVVIPGTSTFHGQVGGNDNNFHFEDALSSIPHIITGILRKKVTEKYLGPQR